jgi:hypothetical protein
MKGLILKDLYMSVKYFRNYLLILMLFLGLSFTGGDNLFLVFYPGLLAAMIPVNLLAYDERSHWDIYCGTLPVTRDMVVSAKYLLGLMLQGVIYLLTGGVQALRMAVNGIFHLESFLVLMSLLWMVFLFSGSITLPFMFKLGVEKGRMAYYVMIGIICGSAAISGSVFGEGLQATISFGAVLIIGCFLAAVAYAGSWYLSILFYRKRELH